MVKIDRERGRYGDGEIKKEDKDMRRWSSTKS
jgi:hypothetical protein